MPSTKIYDVAVVGAGPTGLNVTRVLADKGYEVILLEKKLSIGEDVVCAGIVGTEAFEHFDLPKELVVYEIRSTDVVSPFGTTVSYTHPTPLAYVLDRKRLDTFLLKAALDRGAEVKVGCKVINVDREKNYLRINTEKKNENKAKFELKAKLMILATGVEIDLLRKLRLGHPHHFLNSAQKIFAYKHNGRVTLLTGSAISKGGFGWIVPEGECSVKVGLMTEDTLGKKFEILKERVSGVGISHIMSKKIAQGLVSKTFDDRVLSVGGCAGQVKTTTGGGIYFGLLCSQIAGEVVSEGLKRGTLSASFLSKYEDRWQGKIGTEIKIGMYLRRLWSGLSDEQIDTLFRFINSDGILEYVSRRVQFDWHVSPLIEIIKKKEIKRILNILKD